MALSQFLTPTTPSVRSTSPSQVFRTFQLLQPSSPSTDALTRYSKPSTSYRRRRDSTASMRTTVTSCNRLFTSTSQKSWSKGWSFSALTTVATTPTGLQTSSLNTSFRATDGSNLKQSVAKACTISTCAASSCTSREVQRRIFMRLWRRSSRGIALSCKHTKLTL